MYNLNKLDIILELIFNLSFLSILLLLIVFFAILVSFQTVSIIILYVILGLSVLMFLTGVTGIILSQFEETREKIRNLRE